MKLGTHPDIRVERYYHYAICGLSPPSGCGVPESNADWRYLGSEAVNTATVEPALALCTLSCSPGLTRIEDRPIFRAAIVCIVVCVSATCETQETALKDATLSTPEARAGSAV